MVGRILLPEIQSMIDARNFTALRELFSEMPPADVAEIILDLPEDEQVIIFRILPHALAADVFEYLDVDVEAQQKLLRGMAHEQVVSILNEMSPDDRTALLEELPSAAARQLIRLLTPEERRIAQSLLGYPEGSVGRLMTPDLVAVDAAWTVKEVLDYIREHGQDSETLNVIYVVDDRGKLIDDIRIREFLLRPLETKVSDLMDENFIALNVTDSQEEAVNVFRKYDRTALAGARFERGPGWHRDDRRHARRRGGRSDRGHPKVRRHGGDGGAIHAHPALADGTQARDLAGGLFLGEMLTASAMGYYEGAIAKAVVLALFLPMIISSGGNSGSQASMLIIRAMALGEVTLRDWWRVMRKEVVAGVMLGCVLGTIGFLRVAVWAQFSDVYGPHYMPDCPYRGDCARWSGALGVALGFNAAFFVAPPRRRSGDVFSAIRSDAG